MTLFLFHKLNTQNKVLKTKSKGKYKFTCWVTNLQAVSSESRKTSFQYNRSIYRIVISALKRRKICFFSDHKMDYFELFFYMIDLSIYAYRNIKGNRPDSKRLENTQLKALKRRVLLILCWSLTCVFKL